MIIYAEFYSGLRIPLHVHYPNLKPSVCSVCVVGGGGAYQGTLFVSAKGTYGNVTEELLF